MTLALRFIWNCSIWNELTILAKLYNTFFANGFKSIEVINAVSKAHESATRTCILLILLKINLNTLKSFCMVLSLSSFYFIFSC